MKLRCPPNLTLSEARAVHTLLEVVVDALITLHLDIGRTYPLAGVEPDLDEDVTWQDFATLVANT